MGAKNEQRDSPPLRGFLDLLKWVNIWVTLDQSKQSDTPNKVVCFQLPWVNTIPGALSRLQA